ncbi:MAG: carbon-nitrogen hydrolase family protein [Halanaerobiales bacterium]
MDVKIGMGQIMVEGGKAKENIIRAVSMIEKAAGEECDIVVLPECLDVGWTYPDTDKLAEPIPGIHSDLFCRVARERNINIVLGLSEKEGNKIYNTALFINRTGEILLKHRKINILDIAQNVYTVGDRLGVVDTEFGRIGINICADNFPDFLSIGRSLGKMGAVLLLSPSAWAVKPDHDNVKEPYGNLWLESYRTLSREYNMAVVGVSNVGVVDGGPWDGYKCIGCSLAVGPGGKILGKSPYGKDKVDLNIISLTL